MLCQMFECNTHRLIWHHSTINQPRKHLKHASDTFIYEAHHELCSGAVICNFDGYTEPRVFVVRAGVDSDVVAGEILDYMIEASEASYRYECLQRFMGSFIPNKICYRFLCIYIG